MLTLTDLASALRSGALPLSSYLTELEAHYRATNPNIQAFISEANQFDLIRRAAVRLLRDYPDPEKRPPLFGIPVGIKDIIHVAGYRTRAGSLVPSDVLQGSEAECVRLLRQAGALILGKTATTEFAYLAPAPTRNPRSPNLAHPHTPGGSSSGSAAAVAAGLVPLALGTQTVGSLIRPAAYCGVPAFKPTYGRVSLAGVLALAPSFDHLGWFAQSVADLEMVAAVLCQAWPNVPSTNSSTARFALPPADYLAPASPAALAHFLKTVQQLEQAGWERVPTPELPPFEQVFAQNQSVLSFEAAQTHAHWFAQFADCYQPQTAALLSAGQAVSASDYQNARQACADFRANLAVLMHEQAIDVWLSPAALDVAPAGLTSTGSGLLNLPWSQAGCPVCCLPNGCDASGLPFGLQIIGGFGLDSQLLQTARQINALLQRHSGV